MNVFLQILGSVASIGSIPLAIYLYLRSREARFNKLKREIVKILSYQIGEGRNLTIFEIKAVIVSKVREAGIKSNSIYVDEIVEDLVSETIYSPMLDRERKKEILNDLKSIHQKGKILTSIERYDISYRNLIECIQNHNKLLEEDAIILKNEAQDKIDEKPLSKPRVTEKISEIFAFFAGIATIIAFTITIIGEKGIQYSLSKFFNENAEIIKIGLSVIVTIIASIMTIFINLYSKKRIQKNKRDKTISKGS